MLSIVWLCHLFSRDFRSEQNCFKAHKNANLFHFLQPVKQISAFTDAVGTAKYAYCENENNQNVNFFQNSEWFWTKFY